MRTGLSRNPLVPEALETLARFRLVRSLVQSRYLHGIDFKNPFTMSKRSVSLLIPLLCRTADLVSSSLDNFGARGGAYRDRTDDLMLAKQPLSQLS